MNNAYPEFQSGEEFVFCKLDYYSCMIKHCTFSALLKFLHLNFDELKSSFENIVECSMSYGARSVFTFNNIRIEFLLDEYKLNSANVLEHQFSDIRLNISGEGLDYLRSIGMEVDKVLRDPDMQLPESHVTRADFAFDFVNYGFNGNNYLDITGIMIDYVLNNVGLSECGCLNRCSVRGFNSGLLCKVDLNDRRCVYFGSSKSDKVLRIYDKRVQYINIQSGIYIKDNPYNDPASWHRIELQTRNKYAQELLFSSSEGGLYGILRYIFERFTFMNMKTPAHRRELFSPWQEIFDWEKIPELCKFAFSEIFEVPKIDKITTYFETQEIRHFLIYASKYSGTEFMQILRNYLHQLQCPESTLFPEKYKKMRVAFATLLSECNLTPEYFMSHNNSILSYDPVNKIYSVNDKWFYSGYSINLIELLTLYPDNTSIILFDKNNQMLSHGYPEQLSDYYSCPVMSVLPDDNNKILIYLNKEF